MKNQQLKLDDKDPRVIAARDAEKALFDFYELKAIDHYILLPEQNIRIRVSEIGSGEPLLIVPGNTGDVFPLASLLAQFKNRRLIAVNRPGGGLSEGMDHRRVDIRPFAVMTLMMVLDKFGIEQTDIVAHSMGAHWSLWFAMDNPSRVRSLALLGNPGNVLKGGPPLILRILSKPPFANFLFRIMLSGDRNKALRSLGMMGHAKSTITALPQAFGDCYFYFRKLPHYLISLTSLMENEAPLIDEKQLKTLSQACLLILGSKDNFASVATGEKIVKAMPHGELQVMKDAGHLPWLDDPDLCGNLILRFLAARNA